MVINHTGRTVEYDLCDIIIQLSTDLCSERHVGHIDDHIIMSVNHALGEYLFSVPVLLLLLSSMIAPFGEVNRKSCLDWSQRDPLMSCTSWPEAAKPFWATQLAQLSCWVAYVKYPFAYTMTTLLYWRWVCTHRTRWWCDSSKFNQFCYHDTVGSLCFCFCWNMVDLEGRSRSSHGLVS